MIGTSSTRGGAVATCTTSAASTATSTAMATAATQASIKDAASAANQRIDCLILGRLILGNPDVLFLQGGSVPMSISVYVSQ